VLVLSPTLAQAKMVFGYALGFLEASPILKQKIIDTTTNEIRLRGNIVIATHPASYKSVRGRTLIGCVFDESAFWKDEASALPDVETYRAVLPSLSASGGMLIGISSPHRRVGLLHTKHRDHFGQDGDVLIIQGSTEQLNPTINKAMVARAYADDPAAAMANWGGLFRNDLSQYLDDAVIDASINHNRPSELPPQPGVRYVAFVDASAGRHDAFTLSIGHKEGDRFVADVVRGRLPKFNPNTVAGEYAQLAKQYRVSTIVGDHFAGEWTAQAFRATGIDFKNSKLNRSELYLEALPHWMRGCV